MWGKKLHALHWEGVLGISATYFCCCVSACVLVLTSFIPLQSHRLSLAEWPLDLVVHYPFIHASWSVEYISVSPVPLLRDSRGFSLGLSGLLGHSFVIMTFDPCRPVCLEECRRCLPSLRLMVSRWLFLSSFFSLVFFSWARHLESSTSLCCSQPAWWIMQRFCRVRV